MTEGRPSKGNLVRVLNQILKELQEIKSALKGTDVLEKDENTRFRNQSKDFRKG